MVRVEGNLTLGWLTLWGWRAGTIRSGQINNSPAVVGWLTTAHSKGLN